MGNGQVKKERQPYLSTYPQPDFKLFNQDMSKWMKNIDDERYISAISIPGTHQSLAKIGGPKQFPMITIAQCQSWDIKQQLKAGIRLVDLRGRIKRSCCGMKAPTFLGYHGIIDQKIDVKQVLQEVIQFLKQNPSEFIIMFLKNEDSNNDHEANTKAFHSMVSEQERKQYFVIQEQIPKVKEMRGKIYFVPRWDYPNRLRNLQVQNKYNVPLEEKSIEIEKFRQRSLQTEGTDQGENLYLNYLSGSTIKNEPIEYSQMGNKQMYQKVLSRGVIMMDFPGEKLIQDIIDLNKIPLKELQVHQSNAPALDNEQESVVTEDIDILLETQLSEDDIEEMRRQKQQQSNRNKVVAIVEVEQEN